MARKEKNSQFEKDRARREVNSEILKKIANKIEAEKNGKPKSSLDTIINKEDASNSRYNKYNNIKENVKEDTKSKDEKKSKDGKIEESKEESVFEKIMKERQGKQAFKNIDEVFKNKEKFQINEKDNKNKKDKEIKKEIKDEFEDKKNKFKDEKKFEDLNKTRVFKDFKNTTKIDSKTNILELARLRQEERDILKRTKEETQKKVDTLDNLVLEESEVVVEEAKDEKVKSSYLEEREKITKQKLKEFSYEDLEDLEDEENRIDVSPINGAFHIILITILTVSIIIFSMVFYVFKNQEIMKYITFREVGNEISNDIAIKEGKNIEVVGKEIDKEEDVHKKYGYIKIGEAEYPIYAFNKKNAVKGMLLYRYSENKDVSIQILNVDADNNIKEVDTKNPEKAVGEKAKLVFNQRPELKLEQEYIIKKVEVKTKVDIKQDKNTLYIIEKVQNSKTSSNSSASAYTKLDSDKDDKDKKIIIILEKTKK